MKLLDITIALAETPNGLWSVKNYNGYYRITGLGERKIGNYYGQSRKVVKTLEAVRVTFQQANAEWSDLSGELIPAQPDRITESGYVESFLPSQIEGIAETTVCKGDTYEYVRLTLDNFLQVSIDKRDQNKIRKEEESNKIQKKVATLNTFLDGSYEIKEWELTDKYHLSLILDAVINKLEKAQ
jgi:hypothetical protein